MTATAPSYYYPSGSASHDTFHQQHVHQHQTSHRSMSATTHCDRPMPYHYHELPRHDARSEHSGRLSTHALISEPGTEPVPGKECNLRRRTAVACSRCRKRKIKCTGDPGDGSGCAGCKQATGDASACTFVRVNAFVIGASNVEPFPQASSLSQTASYLPAVSNTTPWPHHNLLTRSSLPTLHTRSSWMDNYDTYETSPTVDAHNYVPLTTPRLDSYASSYGALENYRSWSTTGSSSAPVPANCYNYQLEHSLRNWQGLAYPNHTASRLPSLTGDNFSPLNMAPLHSALPPQTVQERHLPTPTNLCSPGTVHTTTSEVPEVRPLTMHLEPRVPYMHRIHSRAAMPWVTGQMGSSSSLRSDSMSDLSFPFVYHLTPRIQQASQARQTGSPSSSPHPATTESEGTILGYQFHNVPSATSSPSISPTTLPPVANTLSTNPYSTRSRGKPLLATLASNNRSDSESNSYAFATNIPSQQQYHSLRSAVTKEHQQQRSNPPRIPNLYSFSTESTESTEIRPYFSDSTNTITAETGLSSSAPLPSYIPPPRDYHQQHHHYQQAVFRANARAQRHHSTERSSLEPTQQTHQRRATPQQNPATLTVGVPSTDAADDT